MEDPAYPTPGTADRDAGFQTTQWAVVVRARHRDSADASAALASLCHAYWYPLYSYIRHQVASADHAEELTQEFFTRLLSTEFLNSVDPARGRFRAYLLACCKHFLINERQRETALKRGGGRKTLQLDLTSAEERYLVEPAHEEDAEAVFERQWAQALLARALKQLAEEYEGRGQGVLYKHLEPGLVCVPEALPLARIGEELAMSEAAVKKAAQRLRDRYRRVLREHIAATVGSWDEVEDEIRHLFLVLGG